MKIMQLNKDEFESLKFLTGINYPVDNITLEIAPSLLYLEKFLGKYVKELEGYNLVRFVKNIKKS